MEKSQLFQLINSFSAAEKKEIARFLESPWFNQRADLIRLFQWYCQNNAEDMEQMKLLVLGNTSASDQEIRLRMTYLMRLLERYLAQKQWESEPVKQELQALRATRKRGLVKPFEKLQRSVEKHLESAPHRDMAFYQTQYELNWEIHQMAYQQNPTELPHLHTATAMADAAYLSLRLRMICLHVAHQGIYRDEYQSPWEKEIVDIAHQHFAARYPAVATYLHCYRMMKEPEQENHFLDFKKILLEEAGIFSRNEIHGLFIWAINYCIRKINQGERHYYKEALDLYKAGLSTAVLLEQGNLSRFTYFNIVAAGINSGDLNWVEDFIEQYRQNLEKQQRDSAYSFNLARLQFARKNYQAVLELLQQANYRDVLVTLAIKTLLLKTFYELDEYDLLLSHLDAMQNYIRRKRVLGYHRTNYLNIIRYTNKLLQLSPGHHQEREQLVLVIQAEVHLTEKDWFMEKLARKN